jgi:hypothetical protein
MSFPISPSNNQTAIVNGITYIYNLPNNTWTRVSIVNPANSAFIQANAAFAQANSVYAQSNTQSGTITSAFNQANTAFTQANAAFGAANNASLVGISAGNYANGAFAQANAAFNTANTDVTNVSITAGSYGSAAIVPTVTVTANGRISAISNTTIAIPASAISSGVLNFSQGGSNATSYTTGALLTSNGTAIISLANTGTAGTYGNGSIIPVLTTDAYGRVSAVSNTFIGGTTPNALTMTNATAASSVGTGALTVSGGVGVTGNLYANSAYSNNYFMQSGSNLGTASITFIIDGGGSAITTGAKGDLTIPFNCTINNWTLLADQSGSIVIDIWKTTYANAPPVVANTITGTALPTLSTASKNTSSVLTGWTTTITAGDVLRYNVNSISTVTRTTLSLQVTKT